MNRICLEYLEPGMTLAKDVSGLDGSVLFTKGQSIDPTHLETMRDMGVGSVFVQEKLDDQEIVRRAEEYVRKFFLYVNPDSEVFIELFRLSMAATVEAVRKGWHLPCENELHAHNVEHMTDLFHKGQGSAKDIVDHETELSSFPDTYFKIKEVLESPTSSADDIANVVSADVGLSAKLLKLVNSPFYGLPTTVDSVTRAVSLIGVKELTTLALGISTINFFKDIPPELIDMKTFWRHSLSCGVFGKLIASRVKGLQPERFFTAGLLHDCGRLIIFKNMPYGSVDALLYARRDMVPLVEAEYSVFGFDHTEVGRLLLEEWQFPESLTAIIARHHSSSEAKDHAEAAVIELADNMANAAGIATGAMFVLPGMDEKSWKKLGLQTSDLKEMMETHDRNIEEITKALL